MTANSKKKIKFIAAVLMISSCLIILYLAVMLAYFETQGEAENYLQNKTKLYQSRLLNFFSKTTDSLNQIRAKHQQCNQQTKVDLKTFILNQPEISIAYLKYDQSNCASLDSFDMPQMTERKQQNHHFIGPLNITGIYGNAFGVVSKQAKLEAAALFPGYVIEEKTITNTNGDIGFSIIKQGQKEPLYKTTPLPKASNSLVHNTTLSPFDDLQLQVLLSKDWIWQKLFPHIVLALMIGLIVCIFVIVYIIRRTKHKLSLESEIAFGVKHQQFIPYYQVVKDLKTNKFTGVECLMRWQINHNEILYPDFFIPAAEKTGLIKPMTEQLISQIFKDLGCYLKENVDFHIAINLSPQHLKDRCTFELINNYCKQYLVNTKQVILELTEQELLEGNVNCIVNLMNEIRQAGFSIALDDFGTGYSSINYLRQFPFDYLKIDKLFVMAIGSGAITAQLADSIIDMAKNLQLKIIAEGIENSFHEEYLQQKQVEYGQGWLYSKAIPFDQLQTFLKS